MFHCHKTVALICFFSLALTAQSFGQDPVRKGAGNWLDSSALPQISIELDSSFRYLGRHAFTIRDMAQGERHIFVDAKNGKAQRLFIAQFESILPTSDEIYRYSFTNAKTFGAHKFRHNTFAFNLREAARENPQSESALTAKFLTQKGLRWEDEWMMSRFVAVPDAAKKHELILFYVENVSATKHRVSDFYQGDAETKLWQDISHGLAERSLRAFSVLSPGFAVQMPALQGYFRANQHRWLQDLAEFLKLPNVASDRENIRRNAAHLAEMMRQRGLEPRLLEAKDPNAPPVVFAEWKTPGAQKTLVFYAHYDGQPVNPAAWTASPPWQPTLRTDAHTRGGAVINFPTPNEAINPDWRLYARGASDDKAGVVAILNAFEALRAVNAPLAVNIKFFFEGEEEAGSPHLGEILAAHKDLLKSDGWIICDGPVHQSGRKQVVFGVRGDTNVDVTTYGPKRPLHSGHYGNWAPNPAMILAKLLASMKDANGRVLIKGWYADAEPFGPAERRALREVPDFDQAIRDELGLARTEGAGLSLNELIAQPSLNINGMSSADVGPLARNVIPTTATAALDLRLVKGNDYRRQVEKLRAHIRAQGFHVIDRDPTDEERRQHPLIAKIIHRSGGYNAQRSRLDLPLGRDVVAAVQTVSATPVVRMPTLGGSLPLSIITETLNTEAITVPIANYDNNQHAENENIRLGNLWDGIEIYAALMTMPGKMP